MVTPHLKFIIGTELRCDIAVQATIFTKNDFDAIVMKHINLRGLNVGFATSDCSNFGEKSIYVIYEDSNFKTLKRLKLNECTITLGWYEDQADETAIYYQTSQLSVINKMFDNILITTVK